MEGGPAQGNMAKKGTTTYGLLPTRPSAGQHGTTHPVASVPGDHGPLGAGFWRCPDQWRGSVESVVPEFEDMGSMGVAIEPPLHGMQWSTLDADKHRMKQDDMVHQYNGKNCSQEGKLRR